LAADVYSSKFLTHPFIFRKSKKNKYKQNRNNGARGGGLIAGGGRRVSVLSRRGGAKQLAGGKTNKANGKFAALPLC
jgi:hypothetical protein